MALPHNSPIQETVRIPHWGSDIFFMAFEESKVLIVSAAIWRSVSPDRPQEFWLRIFWKFSAKSAFFQMKTTTNWTWRSTNLPDRRVSIFFWNCQLMFMAVFSLYPSIYLSCMYSYDVCTVYVCIRNRFDDLELDKVFLCRIVSLFFHYFS